MTSRSVSMSASTNDRPPQCDQAPHVVIIGGGFGGLYAARTLAAYPVRITLIDRENYHLFQPLLYQVATAALSRVASPFRMEAAWATTRSLWRPARATRISATMSGSHSHLA